MKTSKKKKVQHNSTLYYRATYKTPSGSEEQEVFISDSMDRAREYAAGPNLLGRQLKDLEEFKEFIDALL